MVFLTRMDHTGTSSYADLVMPSLPPRTAISAPATATAVGSSESLSPLLNLPRVHQVVDRARAACEELRWHEGFRRRWREIRAEADLRAVQASAAIEGARVPMVQVRRLAIGSDVQPSQVDLRVVHGVLRATALAATWRPDLGASAGPPMPPLGEVVARLHTAAARDWLPSGELGRLRRGDEQPRDLIGLGIAPSGAEAAARIALLARMLDDTTAPVLVQVAVLHGELLVLRPFLAGTGVVARTVARLLMTVRGLDPAGAVLAEADWAQSLNPYLGAAARYATGTPTGVAEWLRSYARSVTAGAAHGRVVADAVLAGRLGEPPVGAT